MEMIKLDDLRQWRANYIGSGRAQSFDDMTALGAFIDKVERFEVGYSGKRGHWIYRGLWVEGFGMGETYGSRYECSECGCIEKTGYEGEDSPHNGGPNFCPCCRAYMKGADDE